MVFKETVVFRMFKVRSPGEMTKIHHFHVVASGWVGRRKGDVRGGVGVVPALPQEDPVGARIAADDAERDVDP